MKQLRMSSADYREYLRARQGEHYVGRSASGDVSILEKAKAGKYHAEKTDGYASKKEATRAGILKMLERHGDISELREQVKFELIPAQYDEKGKLLERAMSYVADFVYKDEDGRTVVEDTKGMRTDVYKIKRKLMLWVHGIRIVEI